MSKKSPPKKQPEAPIDIETLPTPLALAIDAFEAESQPFRKVHRLIDAVEVLVKLHTVAAVSHWAREASVHPRVRALLAAGLKTPSLGIWWQFARETARALREQATPPFYPRGDAYLLDGPLFKALEGQDNLLKFRNEYAHGATPPDEACAADVERNGPRLRMLVSEAGHLREARLIAVAADGRAVEGTGTVPRPVPAPAGAVPGHCHLLRGDGSLLSLHPLLVWRQDAGRFFFYNDLRENAAEILNYEACLLRREKELRREILQAYPIHQWEKCEPGEENFRERIEALTEIFKGRHEPLARIVQFMARPSGFLMIWGPPGVGKSALVARAVQVLGWPADVRKEAYPALPESDLDVETIPYFIRRGGATDNAAHLLRNLNQRLESRWRTGLDFGSTADDMRQRLRDRLKAASVRMDESKRLVLLIDGLDEGTDAEGLLEGLPKADLPERVLVVYSSREHPRVRELVYGNLDRERHWELDLAGLSSADVRALLQDSVDKYALEGGYVEAVAERSGGNPQYLRLLVDGLQAGDYRLNDRVSLPRKMEELYDTLTKRFARTPRCVETLCLLAAARDYLTASQAADVLGVPTSEIRDQALPACREVLFENPLTERAEDYQLFHESLREHLRNRYAREVGECAEKLADWCLRWRDHGAEMRAYAVRHAISHLLDSQAAAARERRAELAEKRLRQACGLLDDKAYREEVFLTCGNAGPLQQGLIRAQRLLAERDRDGSELGRIVQYALWYHGEGHRLYEEQLARLDQIGREGGREGMEQAAQLAAMGATPRDRVLLALRALRARDARVDAPPALRKAVEGWLEEAGSGALRELWNETIGPAKV